MLRPSALAGVLLALPAALPARGELAGQPVPPAALEAAWNGAGEKTLKDFREKVLFLEIFATW